MKNYKITRLQKIKEVNNDMAHNFYFLAYFRIYSSDKKHYKHGKFIIWFDAFDVQEYFDQDYYTQEDVKQLACELSVNTLETYFTDFENTKELQDYCNETIKNYNKLANYWYWNNV